MKKIFVIVLLIGMLIIPNLRTNAAIASSPFTFVSIGDAQGDTTRLASTLVQVANTGPDFVLFNGDLENDGVSAAHAKLCWAALLRFERIYFR